MKDSVAPTDIRPALLNATDSSCSKGGSGDKNHVLVENDILKDHSKCDDATSLITPNHVCYDGTADEKTSIPKTVVVSMDAYGVETKTLDDERETWGKKIDFLLSIIGFAVDLANVWRFPYLCYKNGGGAFLIPYFLMLIFGAVPLFFMELVLGQFHRQGAISVWKIAPLFKGIGMAECLIAYYVAFYYNVIIAWSFFYLCASFTRNLPWDSCNNTWNTPACYIYESDQNGSQWFSDNGLDNNTVTMATTNLTSNLTSDLHRISPATEYFERQVLALQNSGGIHDLGSPRWQLVLCLAAVFVILYFSLWKGVKSSGKVVWFTATMPYVVLAILLIRGLLLPGSLDGILYFITPKMDRLGDPQVWIDAAVQIFYSVGAGFGTHLAYSSYNKFSNNCYRDCLITVFVNSFTSLFSGFVVFSYLGYMAVRQTKEIGDVAKEGPGLVFVVYPEAIATLPGSFAWSIIFFIMLLTLGLDSAMGGLEAVLTGLKDELRVYLHKYRYGREALTAIVCLGAFLFAIPNITQGGMYLFTMWDTFAAGTSLLLAVFFQAIAISWVYGLKQFNADIEKMLGFTPGWYWRICWKIISPLFILTIIIASLVSSSPLEYTSSLGVYRYPAWANSLGWCISVSSIVLIPLAAIYQLLKARGSFQKRVALAISPQWEHRAIEQGQEVKRFKARHWISI